MRTIAAELGISDVGLAKACRRMRVPVPGRGYWAKKAAGYNVRRPQLPKLLAQSRIKETFTIGPRPTPTVVPPELESVRLQREFELRPENKIVVGSDMELIHPLVKRTAKALNAVPKSQTGRLSNWRKEYLDLQVSRSCLDRGLRILNAIVLAFDKRGWRVVVGRENQRYSLVKVLEEEIPFGVRERLKRVENPPPKKVKNFRGEWHTPYYQKFEFVSSGELAVTLRSAAGRHIALEWRDGKTKRVEDMLNDFMVAVVARAEDEKEEERKRIAWEREYEKQRARQAAERVRVELEIARFKALKEDAARWETSQSVKAFLADVRRRAEQTDLHPPDSPLALWLAWAEGRADQMDPIPELLADPPEAGDLSIE